MRAHGEVDIVEWHATPAPQKRCPAEGATHRVPHRGMVRRIDDFRIGQFLELGAETVHPAGQHQDLNALPAQFERMNEARRPGADHDDRELAHRIRRQSVNDHRRRTQDGPSESQR